MLTHCWQIVTWPKVQATARELVHAAPRFRHLGTSLRLDLPVPEHPRGSTVWGCDLSGQHVGIAWEWVVVRKRAIAMGDPMTLIANVDMVDDEGMLIPDSRKLLKLHEVIFALPWQRTVRSAQWPDEQTKDRLAA